MRDSSLSACIQAVIAAEVGHLELAYDYFGEAALMDLDDLEHNTARRPAHRLAGRRLDRAVAGLRRHARPRRHAAFAPRLPPHGSTRLAFRLCSAAGGSGSTSSPGEARYELLDGEPLELPTTASSSRSTRRARGRATSPGA